MTINRKDDLMDEKVIKRGRPRKPDSKNRRCSLRLTDDELAYLDYISSKTDSKKSDILRKALKMYYNLEKCKR